jgi:site-specific recombinase XerD
MTKSGTNTLFGMIHDYLKIYLPKQRNYSPHTIRSYREALELFVDFVKEKKKIPLQNVTFEMLTAEMINEYLDYLETERGCTTATRNNRLASVRAFLVFAADRDLTAVVQLSEMKKVPVKKTNDISVIKYMSAEAVKAVVEQPDSNTTKGLRDRMFMILMYDLGARLQEMTDIKISDLSFGKTTTVLLHGKGAKVRTVPIMENTVGNLRKYLTVFHPEPRKNEDRLFYTVSHGQRNPLSASCVRLFLAQYGNSARESCIEVPENVHPHLFRHSRAMHLYQEGMDLALVSQWLGHAQLETTLIYAHADTEHKRKAIAAATPPDNPLYAKLNSERFTISDEDTIKRLAGLR